MSQSLIQRSFAGGEITPALAGRADQTKYQTGLKTCRNFVVQKHGGVANRAGTGYVVEVLDSTVRTYMIKFVFNDDQTYVIEVGEEYFRFIRAGARIIVAGVAAFNVLTNYAMGDLVSNLGVNYYSKTDGNLGNVPAGSPANWYALDGVIYEIPHPYAPADLALLKFVQSGDVVTITHPSYATRELTRTGHTNWTLRAQTFAPSQAAPVGLVVTAAGAGAQNWRYKVTAIKTDSYEESLPSASATDTGDVPTTVAPHTLAWTATAGAVEYNVYRETSDGSGFYAFIGVAGTNSFTDNGFIADPSISPPITRNPFPGAGDFPGTCSYYQQRLVLARTNNKPETTYTSRTAMFDNFTISSPLQDDDAVTFTIAGRKVNEVRHLVEIGELVILTAGGEWVVLGDADGTLRANQPPNLKQIGYNGSSDVMPAVINNSLIYVQARGNVVRDLRNEVTATGGSTYNGRDLTVFAGHLFTKKTIERMDYAQIPNSIVWAVRSDGKLLGLTYLREHEVWGWHIHDTDGFFEDVCVVPEGDEDAVYVIVRRVINGVTKRYIERFASREFTDIEVDAIFLDSYLSYDGRNTTATTMTLSTGAGWTVDDDITVTASAAQFIAGDVGNDYIVYRDVTVDGVTTRHEVAIRVTGFTSNVIVTGTPSKTVPVELRGVATAIWTRAVDSLTGLDHLALKDVGVFADGNVIASPNNDKYDVLTVTAGGGLSFDRPYGVIHAGLGYLSDFRTLDLDIAGEQIRDRRKNITGISLLVQSSRGIFAGPDEDNLDELQPTPVDDFGEPWPLETGIIEMVIANTWNESGSFLVRQKDPLPLTILSAIPSGDIGG